MPISYVKKAFDHLGVSIEQHLSCMSQSFDLRYSVESFTTVRALVAEGICAGILPIQTAAKLLEDGSIVHFSPEIKPFGEYKVCATCVHDLKNEPKIAKLIEILINAGRLTRGTTS